jgi:hypothetical protein
VRQGGYLPDARIKDMDLDGVAAEVVYPTVGFLLYNMVDDSALLSANFKAYNDWLEEKAMIAADNVARLYHFA